MLDLRRLAVFREVAEQGSFSAAALALDYTQSVVSHHVAQLERELGVSLFERGKRPVRLTPAGERLNAHAAVILGAARAAESDLHALTGLQAGALRIGAFLSACATFVPAAIGAFSAAHPAVDVRLDQHEPDDVMPRLVAGEIDLAVIWRETGAHSEPDERVTAAKLGDDPYRVVLPAAHRLARRRELGLADLRDERFAAPRAVGSGVQYHELIGRLCEEQGFTPDFAYTVDAVTAAPAYVAAGLCVAVMPDMTIPHAEPGVVVKPLRGVEPSRSVHALWLRDRRAPGVEEMAEELGRAAGKRLAGRGRS